jgi:hypothetical protein
MGFRELIPYFCVLTGAGGSGAKPPRYYNIVLESESEQPTDEDNESVHSIQGKETGLFVVSLFFLLQKSNDYECLLITSFQN